MIYTYNDHEYEVLIEKNAYIYNKKENTFHLSELSDLENSVILKKEKYKYKISEKKQRYFWIIYFIMFLSIAAIFINILFENNIYVNFPQLTFYILLPFFFFVHEFGHIIFLRKCKKKEDKIGFKFLFIFPAIYVEMNQIYLLSKKERLIINNSGIMSNFLFIAIIYLVNQLYINSIEISLIIKQFIIITIFNLLPIYGTDGHKNLLLLMNLEVNKNKKENVLFVKITHVISIIVGILLSINFILNFFSK